VQLAHLLCIIHIMCFLTVFWLLLSPNQPALHSCCADLACLFLLLLVLPAVPVIAGHVLCRRSQQRPNWHSSKQRSSS
jgi:hypothetical protein